LNNEEFSQRHFAKEGTMIGRAHQLVAIACIGGLTSLNAQSEGPVGTFPFQPLATSAACDTGAAGSFPFETPLVLPSGYAQVVLARESDAGTLSNWDMNTLNESGPHAGRFLYRTHETDENGQVSVTDLETGDTRVLVERFDWNRMDGIVWTPWQTLLAAEEMRPGRTPSTPDPEVPLAQAGLVYEVDPATGDAVPRPALGAKAHEGMRLDPQGNVYGISETAPPSGGYIFRFVPDRPADLSTGQLYALKIVSATANRTGEAVWVPLDRDAVQVDADAAATAAGATGYGRPEDVEIATSTGNTRGGSQILFVAITDEDRVLRIELRTPAAGPDTAFVSDYVVRGVNAPSSFPFNAFSNPDNLALDKNGNLFITEDVPSPGNLAAGRDIWVALPAAGTGEMAAATVRFASVTVCRSEPTGVYFDRNGQVLFVNIITAHRNRASIWPLP
jgi:hypothetical protein